MPILANDPHLGISQPGIWMQMGLHCREVSADCTLDTSGFTFSADTLRMRTVSGAAAAGAAAGVVFAVALAAVVALVATAG